MADFNEERARQAYEQSVAVYKQYQENIKKSELLKTEILLGAKNKEDLKMLMVKAAECIGLLTGDTKVYVANMKEYISKY